MTSSPRHYTPPAPGIVVVMPARNEADAIGGVLAEIQTAYHYPVFVVDDASTDNTAAIAREAGATVISLPIRLGAWGATQTGLRYARRHRYAIAITMDADGQHDCRAIPEILRPVLEQSTDLAIGACTRRGSWMRQLAWRMMRRVSGLTLDDITSGFRVYNHRALCAVTGWRATLLDYQDVGVLLLLQSQGLQIVDVEVPMRARTNGKSRIFHSWLIVAYYMCHTLLLGLSKRRMARQYRFSG